MYVCYIDFGENGMIKILADLLSLYDLKIKIEVST